MKKACKKKHFSLLKHLLYSSLIILCVFKAPEIHYNYIRNKVGSRVVEITNQEATGGGTGFHVKAPSGKTYILTNSHVCEHTQVNGLVSVHDEFGNVIPRRILLDSDFTDLCVIEGMPGVEGLSLGGEVSPGDIVAVVGHPKLMPLTMTRGEVIAQKEVKIMDHIIDPTDKTDKCSLPKNKIEEALIFGFIPAKVCLIKVEGYLSTVPILPGNSGSPVVDFFGRVVGVVFAGDSDSTWGIFITLPDVIKTLKAF